MRATILMLAWRQEEVVVLVGGEADDLVLVEVEEACSSNGRGRVTSRGGPQFHTREQDGGRGGVTQQELGLVGGFYWPNKFRVRSRGPTGVGFLTWIPIFCY